MTSGHFYRPVSVTEAECLLDDPIGQNVFFSRGGFRKAFLSKRFHFEALNDTFFDKKALGGLFIKMVSF